MRFASSRNIMTGMLVLGGSRFVGRAIVDAALVRGVEVAVLNNDPSPPSTSSPVEHIRADRNRPDEVLAALRGRSWATVVDTWQGNPEAVFLTGRVLQDSVQRYCYVSSIAVYEQVGPGTPGPLTEQHARIGISQSSPLTYAERKSAAEERIVSLFHDRALIVRPGLIVGPWEYVGRLPWWLIRMSEFPRVMCPEPRNRQLQWVDARDMAEWVVHSASSGESGCYNLVCSPGQMDMETLLTTCREVTGRATQLSWTSEQSLKRAGVVPWTELPLWIPKTEEGSPSAYDVDSSRACARGARFRPLEETVADVWAWMHHLGPHVLRSVLEVRPWLTRAKEEKILAGEY
jgi:2'-hydroxyisoflavone reductase